MFLGKYGGRYEPIGSSTEADAADDVDLSALLAGWNELDRLYIERSLTAAEKADEWAEKGEMDKAELCELIARNFLKMVGIDPGQFLYYRPRDKHGQMELWDTRGL